MLYSFENVSRGLGRVSLAVGGLGAVVWAWCEAFLVGVVAPFR